MPVERFISKPTRVTAIQWTGGDECLQEIRDWIDAVIDWGDSYDILTRTSPRGESREWTYQISLREGWVRLNKDDWLVLGVDGEIRPCNPQIFADTFQKETGIKN